MTTNNISSGVLNVIKTFIITCSNLWNFLTQPIVTLDLTNFYNFLTETLGINLGFEFGIVDFSLLWICTAVGILVFILLKVITLINPFG